MKALSVLAGLLFDDVRLVSVLAITIVVAAILRVVHHTAASPYVMAVGLLVALLYSVEHQLQQKRKRKP